MLFAAAVAFASPPSESPEGDSRGSRVAAGIVVGAIAGLVVGVVSGEALAVAGTAGCSGDCGDGGGGSVILLGTTVLGTLVGGAVGGTVAVVTRPRAPTVALTVRF